MNIIKWNWENLNANSYMMNIRLYQRYFILTTTWSRLAGQWNTLLCETNSKYDNIYDITKWTKIETPTCTKEYVELNKTYAFKCTIEHIINKYDDESTRLINELKHLYQ